MVFLFSLVSSASFGTGNPGLAEPIHRGDRVGTGNPGFAVPDFYPAGLLPHWTFTRGPVWYGGDRFSVPNLLYRCRIPVL